MTETAHEGAIIFDLLAAGVLTLILGAVALLRLQRAIVRNMQATGTLRRLETTPQAVRPRRAADTALTLAVDDAAAEPAAPQSEEEKKRAPQPKPRPFPLPGATMQPPPDPAKS